MFIKILFFNILLFSSLPLYAQVFDQIGGTFTYGKVPIVLESDLSSYEINFQKQITDKKDWAAYYNFPTIILNVGLVDFTTSDLNQSYYIFPSIRFKQHNKKINLVSEIGVGFAYFTSKNRNIISSPLMYISNIKLGVEFNTKYLTLFPAISLYHFSNGSLILPNISLNPIALAFQINYKFKSEHTFDKTKNLDQLYRYRFNIGFGIGTAENKQDQLFTNLNPVYVFSLFLSRKIKIFNLRAGLDSYYLVIKKQPDFEFTINFFAGTEFMFGKTSILTQIGYKFYDTVEIKSKDSWVQNYIVEKVGLLYKINRFISPGIILNINYGQSIFMELNTKITF